MMPLFLAYKDFLQNQNNLKEIKRTMWRIGNIQNILIDLQKIESAKSDYIITGESTFLNSYNNELLKLKKDTKSIRIANKDNKVNPSSIDSLLYFINKKIEFANESINFRNNQVPSLNKKILINNQEIVLMSTISNLLESISSKDFLYIENLKRNDEQHAKNRISNLVILIIIILLAFIIIYYLINKAMFLLSQIQDKIKTQNQNLENEVAKKINDYNNVIERVTDAFVSFDNDWNYNYVNKKATILYGLPLEQIIGKNIWDISPKDSSIHFFNEMNEARALGKSRNVELLHEESGVWYENWIYPDENGVSVYYREINDKKTFEKNLLTANNELNILNERFLHISKATNEAIWDWDFVSNLVWGNEQYLKLLDKNENDKLNYEDFLLRLNPTTKDKQLQYFESLIANQKTEFSVELEFLKSDNNWITLINKGKIFYDTNGNAIRVSGSLQDISVQKNIQQQIILEKEMADTLINSLPGIFYMFDSNGSFIRWNKNILKITGYSDEDMKSLHPIEFVPEDQRDMLAEKIKNVFNFGIDNAEADLYTKNKERIPYYYTGIYIKYNGKDCMMGVGIDISDKAKTQQDLRALASHLQNVREEERTFIAREIHDELGQQLTGLKMNVSSLRKKVNTAQTDIQNTINETLIIIEETIKQVRQITTQLRPSVLDDLGLLSALEWQTEEFQKRYNIQSTIHCNIDFIDINNEKATAIFRIYQESLTNILRHSNASAVSTEITIDAHNVSISINDNGIGFDKTEIANKKTMGLLGIKERTLMLGGTYEIRSEQQKGTMVLVKIPLDH